jgi:hypothetical protein
MMCAVHWKHTAVVTGATLVGAWVAGTPQAPTTITPPVAQSASAATRAEPIANIEEEALRLEARVGRRLAGNAVPASRNPFRFREVQPAGTAASRATGEPGREPDEAEAPPERPPALPEPPLRLIGMATDEAGGTVIRTAVLSTSQGVALVGMGDAVAGYRVTAVEADAVELSDSDGRTRRLALTP